MTEANEYAELVAKAEQAVAAVKDPELRRVAFQKVLDDLLGSGPSREATQRKEKHVSKQKPRRVGPRRSVGRAGPIAYIKELLDEGFFKKPKTMAQLKAELENRGHHIPLTSLSGPLQRLCQLRALRRQRTNSEGGKTTFAYSNW